MFELPMPFLPMVHVRVANALLVYVLWGHPMKRPALLQVKACES